MKPGATVYLLSPYMVWEYNGTEARVSKPRETALVIGPDPKHKLRVIALTGSGRLVSLSIYGVAYA